MTPKTKAEELINKFKMILMDEDTECSNEILCTIIAERCAKVVAEEVLAAEPEHPYFWQLVKKEI